MFVEIMRSLSLRFALLVTTCGLQVAGQSFPDLAVLLAKGWFARYVPQEASLTDCVGFLNRQGISFSLFDLMDPDAKVTFEDFARAVGQSTLLFSGEATIENGFIKKPLGADTWVDYCLLNDIDLQPLWNGFVQRASKGPRQEVEDFFNAGGVATDTEGWK